MDCLTGSGFLVRALSCFPRVRIYRFPVDFRKGMRSLAAFVEAVLGDNPFGDTLFVFTNRSRTSLKCLYWDRTGLALWIKGLEEERFPWPKDGETVLQITPEQLQWLLDGVDIWRIHRHKSLEYSRII